jgi:hypothetical protein
MTGDIIRVRAREVRSGLHRIGSAFVRRRTWWVYDPSGRTKLRDCEAAKEVELGNATGWLHRDVCRIAHATTITSSNEMAIQTEFLFHQDRRLRSCHSPCLTLNRLDTAALSNDGHSRFSFHSTSSPRLKTKHLQYYAKAAVSRADSIDRSTSSRMWSLNWLTV